MAYKIKLICQSVFWYSDLPADIYKPDYVF